LTPEEDEAVVRQINESGAQIVWVGLSTPKQERWMASHIGRLNASALFGVGAAFDMHAGNLRQAPRWMQRSGLEWLFRLASEPRRLWRRYAVNNPRFVLAISRRRPRISIAAMDSENLIRLSEHSDGTPPEPADASSARAAISGS
jgi:N-acetylglucosaminyldiphosphoundecaprenol N-acetyl-beta-D-mannosaminyltransferase